MSWVERDFKDYPIPAPCHGEGHLSLDLLAQGLVLNICRGEASATSLTNLSHHLQAKKFLPHI